ncbi:MAG: dicarboxylate/amino acid:cation symporter, partial [Fuerstiella sp.]|nr:dicarboxylate/amino acid:cation symporter [Fuerstiella sp.]
VTWQRSHEGVPAVSTLSGAQVSDLGAFWQDIAAEHPPGVAGMITTLARSIGDLFLRLLKMVTVPLILTSLVTGVTGLRSQGRFGLMFGRTLFYYMITSLLAITTGMILVNLIQPGAGAILPGGAKAIEPSDLTLVEVLYQQVTRLIPTNPFASIAGGEFLSIISFAIMLGTFINLVGGEHGRRLSEIFASAFAVMMKMTAWVISLAPIGVAAFMVYATSTQGLGVFRTLAWYMLTVFLALVFHAVVILPLILRVFAKRNPLTFVRNLSPALLTAFSTASSNATLPLTLNCVEKRAGISNQTSSFVLPLGATINMDGTALYEVVAVLFIAQATPGFDLSIAQQITVALTALIASIGAAGIPHAGLVMMAIVLQAVGLPLEAQGIIIAVDRVLDMCRTSVNVWSDSCGCAVVEAAGSQVLTAGNEA